MLLYPLTRLTFFIGNIQHDFVTDLRNLFVQIRAAGELSGHAPAAKQEDHEKAEGGAEWSVQTPGQQRGSDHRCEYCEDQRQTHVMASVRL